MITSDEIIPITFITFIVGMLIFAVQCRFRIKRKKRILKEYKQEQAEKLANELQGAREQMKEVENDRRGSKSSADQGLESDH